jgi:multiple sugar transport system substrate-binding protein
VVDDMKGETMHSPATNAVTRRRLLALFGLAAAAPVLYACGGPPAAPTSAPAAAPTTAPAAKPAEPTKPAGAAAPAATTAPAAKPAASSPVTLKVIYWSSSPEDHNVFEATFKGFMDKNPGVTVQFDDIPSAEFTQKALTMIVGGTPPDTMELHPAWVLNFILAKQLNDLTDLMKNDKAAFVPQQIDFWSHQSKTYGVPYYSGPSFILYNKTLFKQVGGKTPEELEKEGAWTWEALRDLAKKTTTGSGGDRTFGWESDPANPQFYTCVPIWCNGGEMTDKDETAWLVDQPPVIEVMQWHADMFLKDKSHPMPADVTAGAWLFRTGKVGMAWAGRFRSIEVANATFEVGTVGTPKGKLGPINRDGPNASGLPTGTKNVDTAYKLSTFIGSEDGAPFYLSSGRALPVRTALLESDIFKKSLKPFERLEVFQNAVKTLRAWRVPGKGPEAGRAWKAEWDKIIAGQQDVPTAMKAAKAAMDPLLKV